jgi:hypothetical protein
MVLKIINHTNRMKKSTHVSAGGLKQDHMKVILKVTPFMILRVFPLMDINQDLICILDFKWTFLIHLILKMHYH